LLEGLFNRYTLILFDWKYLPKMLTHQLKPHYIVTALTLLWLSACTAPVIVRPHLPGTAANTKTGTTTPVSSSQIPTTTTDQTSPASGGGLPTTGQPQQNRVAELLQRAANAATPQRQQLQLRAVGLLLQARQQQQAADLLAGIDTSQATTAQQAQQKLYAAEIALTQSRLRRAERLLGGVTGLGGLPADLLDRAYQLRSRLHLAKGSILAAAIDLIQRSTTLTDSQLTRNNEHQIWQLLNSVTTSQLQRTRSTQNSTLISGWLDLALTQQSAVDPSQNSMSALRSWQSRYPDHPAAQRLLFDLAPGLAQQVSNLPQPHNIALLLPLSSNYAREAKVIQDSILDASQTTNRSLSTDSSAQIRIYDIGDDTTLAGLYYRQAVQQGADWVIGPLGKQAVSDLVANTELTVPTLLLAILPATVTTNATTFQLGLPPEQEAQRLAERAARDRLHSPLALYPDTPRGKRLAQAWQKRWQQLGGNIAGLATYDPKISDQSRVLKKYLGIQASELRKNRLQAILRTSLKFQPRRRQDIDHIVLFADAAAGRLIKPQLNFYQAIDLPVYSTSDIYEGKPDKIHDADLNGIHFADMPWIISQQGMLAVTRTQFLQSTQATGDRASRLYALGIDAFRILPHLGYLRNRPDSVYNGVSASMRMDATRRLQRYPLWAVFRNGLAIVDPTDNSLGAISTAITTSADSPLQSGAPVHEINIGIIEHNNTDRSSGGADRWQPPAVPGSEDSPPKLPVPNG